MGRKFLAGILVATLSTFIACYTLSSSPGSLSNLRGKNIPSATHIPSSENHFINNKPNQIEDILKLFQKRLFQNQEYQFPSIDNFFISFEETPWFESKQELFFNFVEDMNVNPYQCNNGDNQYAFLSKGESRNLLRLDGSVVTVYGSVNEDCQESDMSGELDDEHLKELIYENYMYWLKRNWGVKIETNEGVEKISLVELDEERVGYVPPGLLKEFDNMHRLNGLELLGLWHDAGVSSHLVETFECIRDTYKNNMDDNGYNLRNCLPLYL